MEQGPLEQELFEKLQNVVARDPEAMPTNDLTFATAHGLSEAVQAILRLAQEVDRLSPRSSESDS
jgi:hypothetical protein